MVVFILMAVSMVLLKMTKPALRFILAYGVLVSLEQLTLLIGVKEIQVAAAVVVVFLWRFLPVMMAGLMVVTRIRINELIIALEHMHVPNQINIPLTIAFRYLPTVYQELGCIRDNLKLRNLPVTPWQILCQPITAVEQLLVPLLMRSVHLADELAATALCKGLTAYNKRTSASDVHFRRRDWALCTVCILVAAILLAGEESLKQNRNWGWYFG